MLLSILRHERRGHSICAAWSLEIIALWEKMPLEPHEKIATDFSSDFCCGLKV